MRLIFLKWSGLVLVLILSSCTSKGIPTVAQHRDTIRVMTYNVHHCNPPEKSNVIDVDAIAAVIKQQRAGVAAIQEVDVYTKRSGNINQAEQLAQKAGYPYYYFGKAMDYDGGQYGVLILSKYPLSDTQTHMLPKSDPNKGEPRVLATATVTLPNGKAFLFGSTHLEAYNKASRMMQAKEIVRIAGETRLPFVAAGDFNAEENSDVIDVFDEHFVRTCSSCPSTFWEGGETGAIDYIVFRKGDALKVLLHQVVQNKEASDHMPVIAELQFN